MSAVTSLLNAIEKGDPNAADKLMPLVYEELRSLAAARACMKTGQPDATALSAKHISARGRSAFDNRGIVAAASTCCILVERACARDAYGTVAADTGSLSTKFIATETSADDPLDSMMHFSALRNSRSGPRASRKLRFFAGMTTQDATVGNLGRDAEPHRLARAGQPSCPMINLTQRRKDAKRSVKESGL